MRDPSPCATACALQVHVHLEHVPVAWPLWPLKENAERQGCGFLVVAAAAARGVRPIVGEKRGHTGIKEELHDGQRPTECAVVQGCAAPAADACQVMVQLVCLLAPLQHSLHRRRVSHGGRVNEVIHVTPRAHGASEACTHRCQSRARSAAPDGSCVL